MPRFPLSYGPRGPLLLALAVGIAAASALVAYAVTSDTAAPAAGSSSPPPASADAASPPSPGLIPRAAGDSVRERIRARLEIAGVPARIALAGAEIHGGPELVNFYERRGFRPAWVGEDGLGPVADSLVAALAAADREGLRPSDYHLETIRELRQRTVGTSPRPGPTSLAELELLLTDAFLTYADHLVDGRLDPVSLHPKWVPSRSEVDLLEVLERALTEERVGRVLEELRPPHEDYRRLRDALERYRRIASAGGWPTVPEGTGLSPGDTAARVAALRARLRASGEHTDTVGDGADSVYGPDLAEAVRGFQRRHGVEDDGIVGPATLAALNVPAADRVRQIRVNLERWRWLPRTLGERHVRVNAADFRAEVVDDDEVVLSTRVIVGKDYRKTPVMSDRITYLVFSPYWHVPHSLAVKDQLPLQKQDPDHFRRIGMRVLRGWSGDAPDVDPDSIDWSEVSARSFPYRLRQDPGPKNALGRVKFMFPNRFSVYLHDTPGQDLFARRDRSFSSGCIRVERAAELATYLLRNDPAWTAGSIREAMNAGNERTVRLPEAVPVHLLYLTAFSDGETVQFRPDIYDRDSAVRDGLEEASPDAVPAPDAPAGSPRGAGARPGARP